MWRFTRGRRGDEDAMIGAKRDTVSIGDFVM